MDPNETSPQKPYHPANPTNYQPLDTVQLPKPPDGDNVINSDKYFSWSKVRKDFDLPVKRVGLTVIGLLGIIMLLSVLINSVKSLFIPTPPPTQTQPKVSSNPAPVNSNSATKCGNGQVSGSKIDKIFYQQHPELKGRRLTNSEADKPLRAEWCAMGEGLSN
jgi:hypothetical protein